MKSFGILTMLVLSGLSYANEKTLLSTLVDQKCEIVANEPIIIKYSSEVTYANQVMIKMKEIDSKNNRRLNTGRTILVNDVNDTCILVKDKHISEVCILDSRRTYYLDLARINTSDFSALSGGKLRLNCGNKPTIDI